jgi:hypothetical protein
MCSYQNIIMHIKQTITALDINYLLNCVTQIIKTNNELYCYSNEFHSHLPFDRLCSGSVRKEKPQAVQVCLSIFYQYTVIHINII